MNIIKIIVCHNLLHNQHSIKLTNVKAHQRWSYALNQFIFCYAVLFHSYLLFNLINQIKIHIKCKIFMIAVIKLNEETKVTLACLGNC